MSSLTPSYLISLMTSGASSDVYSVMFVLACLAILCLSIACCVLFLGKNDTHRHSFLGRLFNFDYYITQAIVKVLFIWFTVALAVTTVALPVAILISGGSNCITNFFLTLVLMLIMDFVYFLVVRCFNELILVAFNMSEDLRAIRKNTAPRAGMATSARPISPYGQQPATATASPAATAAPAAASPQPPSNIDPNQLTRVRDQEIQNLQQMRDAGVIDENTFTNKRAEILYDYDNLSKKAAGR